MKVFKKKGRIYSNYGQLDNEDSSISFPNCILEFSEGDYNFEEYYPLVSTINEKTLPTKDFLRISNKGPAKSLSDRITQFEYTTDVLMRISGTWKDGRLHGKGRIEVAHTTNSRRKQSASKSFHLLFEGDFVEGKKEGYGSYFYTNNISYVGNYKDDMMHGT